MDCQRTKMPNTALEPVARLKLLTSLDEAETDLEAGRYDDYTDETLPSLACELKSEARTPQR